MFSRSRQMITGMFGVKRAGRLTSFLFSATRESNVDYLRNVRGVACIFLPVHHQMKLKDSVLRSGNDISIKRSLFDARNSHKRAAAEWCGESIDPRSRIPFAVVHESGKAITSRDCLWIGERLLFFGAAGRLSRPGQLGDVCIIG